VTFLPGRGEKSHRIESLPKEILHNSKGGGKLGGISFHNKKSCVWGKEGEKGLYLEPTQKKPPKGKRETALRGKEGTYDPLLTGFGA